MASIEITGLNVKADEDAAVPNLPKPPPPLNPLELTVVEVPDADCDVIADKRSINDVPTKPTNIPTMPPISPIIPDSAKKTNRISLVVRPTVFIIPISLIL
uniref:Uncharacterized protein ORF-c10_045 n=1 Tax=Saccharolobus solfataricus TaxID=2287 RepID=Q9UX74_SACSO|nr:hypothetical protein [Saccharolobus solfataricus P2]